MSKPPKAVIDQPGLKIIVTGLIAALFLGLGLKSQITSIKVSQAVRKSIVSMGSNLEVDFENAEIKLSDWGIPKPYLVINQMRLKNLVKVCGQGQVYVEKLIVPLTFDLIFNPDKAVISPRFNRVEVRVGSTVGCPPLSGPVVAVNVPASVDSKPSSLNESTEDLKIKAVKVAEIKSMLQSLRQKFSTQLSSVRFDLVKVIFEDGFQKNFELRNATVQFEFLQSKLDRIVLQSLLVGLYDSHSNSFRLRSEINSEFNLTDTRMQAQVSLKGKIIDRDFSADARADSDSGLIQISSYIKSMPLKTFMDLSRTTQSGGDDPKTNANPSGYQLSLDYSLNFNLTGELSAEFDLFKNKWIRSSLNNAVIKSDNSSIELNHFDYLKWIADEKYRVQLVIVQFDLNNFYRFFGLSDAKKTLDSLGVFSGTFEVTKNYDAVLNGIVRNMAIVFSTKNKVKLQKITSMNVKSTLAKNSFQLKLSDLSIENQKILGQIEVRVPFNYLEKKLELDPKNLVFSASLKGKILSPEIEQHMFAHEQDYDLNLKLINNGIGRQVQLTAEEFKFSNLQFKKINFFIDLDSNYKPLAYRLQTKTLSFVESESDGSDNDYINFMETYLKEQKTVFPVVVQNFEMKYLIGTGKVEDLTPSDSFAMSINTFSNPKNFVQFKQTGKLNSTSVWQIENVLKTHDNPTSSSQFVLNPSQGTFEKVE